MLELEAQRSEVPVSLGADALAALAEEQRRAGDLDGALRSALDATTCDPQSVAARAALALALLDLGRDAEARRHLATLIGDAPQIEAVPVEIGGFDESELERAFEDASPEADAMHDANEVAFEAMRDAELLAPEGDPVAPGSPFHTRTMASLLESQGDRDAAQAIRASLTPEIAAAPAGGRRRDDVLRTLERWLGRLRRGDT